MPIGYSIGLFIAYIGFLLTVFLHMTLEGANRIFNRIFYRIFYGIFYRIFYSI